MIAPHWIDVKLGRTQQEREQKYLDAFFISLSWIVSHPRFGRCEVSWTPLQNSEKSLFKSCNVVHNKGGGRQDP